MTKLLNIPDSVQKLQQTGAFQFVANSIARR
jgi:hypothetical protein